MPRLAVGLVFAAAALAPNNATRAQADPRTVLDRAINAHGGEERLGALKAGHTRSRGTRQAAKEVPFTQEAYFQLPDRLKEIQQLQLPDQKVTLIVGLAGDMAWMSSNGTTTDLQGRLLAELKSAANLLRATRLVPLKRDRAFRLTALPGVPIDGRPALGLRASCTGYGDVKLYFDQMTGLLAKVERQVVDLSSMQDVTEERFFDSYREFDGVRTPTRIRVLRAGRPFLVAEVLEAKFVERLDDRVFARP
jgi:hypothetical protein